MIEEPLTAAQFDALLPGSIVIYDDDIAIVTTLAPGAISDTGELLDTAWVDAYGSAHRRTKILAGNPRLYRVRVNA